MTRWILPAVAAVGALVGAAAMWGVERSDVGERVRVEAIVHDYMLAHPEILPEAMGKLQEREASRQVAANRPAITAPFGSAFAGNPQGDVTLVEYYDYNCGYCRASLPTIARLVATDPKLRIVFRELPILAPSSRAAARASLAAAAQGRFAAFHDALYAAGPVSDATIAAAAAKAGVRIDPGYTATADAEIARNLATAGQLGLTGTPSWVVGDRVIAGAVAFEDLQKAVAAARAGG